MQKRAERSDLTFDVGSGKQKGVALGLGQVLAVAPRVEEFTGHENPVGQFSSVSLATVRFGREQLLSRVFPVGLTYQQRERTDAKQAGDVQIVSGLF